MLETPERTWKALYQLYQPCNSLTDHEHNLVQQGILIAAIVAAIDSHDRSRTK